ncbi:MAG: PAS domain S-box protein, partial [Ginsengibacter sp.]
MKKIFFPGIPNSRNKIAYSFVFSFLVLFLWILSKLWQNHFSGEDNTEIALTIAIFSFLIISALLYLLKINHTRLRNSAKDDLVANELKYRNLIENAGVVMYTTSLQGNVTFSSTKAVQLTGYTLEELIGMHFSDFVDLDWLEEVTEKYIRQIENNIGETLIEFCIRTKYGDLKWVEQSAVLIFKENVPIGFQCIIKDISERREMEQILRKYEEQLVQNQQRLQSILDNTITIIDIKDLDGKYLLTNKQFNEVFQVSTEEVIGKTAFEFTGPKLAARFTQTDDEVIKTCKPKKVEEIIPLEDGDHNFLFVKFPLLNAQNEIYGIGGIGTDITERVRYQEQLIQAKKVAEEAKKSQEQFLANMSHEIRTPMNGIQGMTDLLLDTKLNDEQTEFAKTIKRSSDNLLVIINDILDFSKIQAGKLTIEKIDFSFSEIMENILSIFRNKLTQKGLTLKVKIDDYVPATLNGDPYRLNQILVNLIGNAIKFTDRGGLSIDVGVESETSDEVFLKFLITDTGIGIEQDKINAIFESFTQATTDTSRKYGGTGLGLAITRQLLELQNGKISVSSEIDKGTQFQFSIPYGYSNKANDPLFLPGKTVKDYSSLLRDKKFLVAEDNEVNQKVICHVLQKAGGTVDVANNGLEAVSLLKENADYCLIIMDLQMPEMDGYAATKYIRNVMKLTIPIVAMTASALKGEKSKCIAIGMNDYLSKPF